MCAACGVATMTVLPSGIMYPETDAVYGQIAHADHVCQGLGFFRHFPAGLPSQAEVHL